MSSINSNLPVFVMLLHDHASASLQRPKVLNRAQSITSASAALYMVTQHCLAADSHGIYPLHMNSSWALFLTTNLYYQESWIRLHDISGGLNPTPEARQHVEQLIVKRVSFMPLFQKSGLGILLFNCNT